MRLTALEQSTCKMYLREFNWKLVQLIDIKHQDDKITHNKHMKNLPNFFFQTNDFAATDTYFKLLVPPGAANQV